MTIAIKEQVVQDIESAAFGIFSIQLYQLTDVASCSQLMVLAKYVNPGSFNEGFLFVLLLKQLPRPLIFF